LFLLAILLLIQFLVPVFRIILARIRIRLCLLLLIRGLLVLVLHFILQVVVKELQLIFVKITKDELVVAPARFAIIV